MTKSYLARNEFPDVLRLVPYIQAGFDIGVEPQQCTSLVFVARQYGWKILDGDEGIQFLTVVASLLQIGNRFFHGHFDAF